MSVKGLDRGQHAALLIVECQAGIVDATVRSTPLSEQVAARGTIANAAALAAWFRARGLPVVHCHVALPLEGSGIAWPVNCVLASRIAKAGELQLGSPLAESHRDLPVMPGDIRLVRHHGMSPFTGTGLDTILRNLRVETVVLSGVSTNVALPGAAIEAVGLGYDAVLAEDCASGASPETHAMQIAMHLPMVSTVSSAAAICAAIEEGGSR